MKSHNALLLVIFSGIGCAAQTPPTCSYILPQPLPDSKYAFTQAGLIALSYAQGALQEADAFQTEQKAESDPQTLLIAMMRHTKIASEAYACAELVLEPYKKSHDQKMIGFTADLQVSVYKLHQSLNDSMLEALRKLPDLSAHPTKLADIISTIEVERGKLWNSMMNAALLTLAGLRDLKRPETDGKLKTLAITRAERKELLDLLLKNFPELQKKDDKSTSPMPIQIAALYYQFLTKPLKCADD